MSSPSGSVTAKRRLPEPRVASAYFLSWYCLVPSGMFFFGLKVLFLFLRRKNQCACAYNPKKFIVVEAANVIKQRVGLAPWQQPQPFTRLHPATSDLKVHQHNKRSRVELESGAKWRLLLERMQQVNTAMVNYMVKEWGSKKKTLARHKDQKWIVAVL